MRIQAEVWVQRVPIHSGRRRDFEHVVVVGEGSHEERPEHRHVEEEGSRAAFQIRPLLPV